MIDYISLYLIITFSLFLPKEGNDIYKYFYYIYIMLIFVLLILFVGLRYKVGGDWEAYLRGYLNLNIYDDFMSNILSWDPGYIIIEYISKFIGLGIYGVNLICAILFFYGFNYFIKSFHIKYSYAFLISFPYLIMVVANGYTRQAVAIGFAMAMYGSFYNKKILKSILFFLLAISFHKTALIIGLVFFANKKIKIKDVLLIILILFVVGIIFFNSYIHMIKVYFIEHMQSKGGIIRIMLNSIAGIVFFIHANKWKIYYDYNIWKLFSLFSFFILFFVLLTNATTLSDRILLYFYPLQIVVFSRFIFFIKNINLKLIYFLFLIVFYWSVLLIWLNFATHRFNWIPYDNLVYRIY